MAKTLEKKCLECAHSVRDPNATPDQVIAGQVAHLCLAAPPTTTPVMTGRGIALMTSYPMVTIETLSCASFASETSDIVRS